MKQMQTTNTTDIGKLNVTEIANMYNKTVVEIKQIQENIPSAEKEKR